MSDSMQQQERVIRVAFVDMAEASEYAYFLDIISRFAKVEISETPDYVFCAEFGTEHLKYNNCIKIFVQQEECFPDMNEYDYVMTFEEVAVYDRCFYFPFFARKRWAHAVKAAMEKHTHPEEYYARNRFCNFLVSNGLAHPFREQAFHALNAYKHVDSAGRFLNNMGNETIAGDRYGESWEQQAIKFREQYRFTLSFENTLSQGGLSEKLFDAWAGGTVPIYWGAFIAEKYVNPDSYINCTSCKTVEEVVRKVREVEENHQQYMKIQRTPIVAPGSEFVRLFNEADDRLTDFFYRIMMQPKEDARRRSAGIRMRVYHQDQRLLALCKKSIFYRAYLKQLRMRGKL